MSFWNEFKDPLNHLGVGGAWYGHNQGRSPSAPGSVNVFGISNRDKKYASKTQAAIRRADYERYKQDLRPIEDRLISMYDNPALRQNQIQGARDSVAKAFSNSDNAYQQRLASYGIQLSPEQQQAYSRRRDLAMGLADITAGNRAARASRDRDTMIMTGGGRRYGLQGVQQ